MGSFFLASLIELHTLVRTFESLVAMSDSDRAILSGLAMQVASIAADQDLARQGDRPSRCCLILEGFAAVTKITSAGRRQIVAFQFTGDLPDLQSVHLRVLDSSISTLTRCRVGFVSHEEVNRIARLSPTLHSALWRAALIGHSILREWVANIGQREAYPRLAHLICEVLTRLRAIGLASERGCPFPFTQTELGDATGMTPVHVNRTLQALRTEGLITLTAGRLEVHDWDRLKTIAGFDPTYLHLAQAEQWAAGYADPKRPAGGHSR